MQSTNKPALYLTPFAQNDSSRAEIPNTTADATRASQTLGFPPLTGLPPEAGGVPPQLPDMNGALNQISRIGWWGQVGGRFTFDPTFAAAPAINGYPRGATLAATSLAGEWISTADDNQINPDTVGTNWVPGYHYGATNLTAMSGGTVTLTPAQAAKKVIIVSGTLTSNLSIVVPAWVYDWTVYNTTAGAFSVTVRTAGQPAVTIPATSSPTTIRCDGVAVTTTAVEIPNASTTVSGISRLATSAETQAGLLDTVSVTPAGFSAAVAVAVPAASTTVAGRIRIGTPTEQTAGALATVAATPAGVKAVGDTKAPIVHTHAAADIVSGTLDLARIPGLPASRITSGVLPADRGGTGLTGAPAVGDFLRGGVSGGWGTSTPAIVRADIGAMAIAGGAFTGEVLGPIFSATGTLGAFQFYDRTDSGSLWTWYATGGVSRLNLTGVGDQVTVSATGLLWARGGFDNPSSRTIKTDLGAFPYGLDQVMSLDPARFSYLPTFRADTSPVLGFYAEDVQAVFPEAVHETPNLDSPLSLQSDQLVPVLWRAVQELAIEVRALRARLEA